MHFNCNIKHWPEELTRCCLFPIGHLIVQRLSIVSQSIEVGVGKILLIFLKAGWFFSKLFSFWSFLTWLFIYFFGCLKKACTETRN